MNEPTMTERIPVGSIPAPDGWTLRFPSPDGGPDDVLPITGWTVYDNGDATPTVAYKHGEAAGWITDANEGQCLAVPPLPNDPAALTKETPA